MTRAEKWRVLVQVGGVVAVPGVLVGLVLGSFLGDGTTRSIVAGGLVGLIISVGMATFDAAWQVELVPRGWREAPFLAVWVSRSLVWLLIIVVGIGVPNVTVAEVPLDELPGPSIGVSIGAGFGAALLFNFIGQVNRLLGRGVLVRLVLGRYHRPREEVRIFLLVDLRGSTEIAEELGNLRYHGFLKRFIGDITTSATRHDGEVHRYVGDEVIIVWKERNGLKNAACVQSVLAMTDALDMARDRYLADFGVAPTFWAGLHLGPVVTGEVGTVKHEIVYVGDTLNTAARIEQACREFQCSFLASAEVVEALTLPADVEAENLGAVELRGVGSSLELVSITRKS